MSPFLSLLIILSFHGFTVCEDDLTINNFHNIEDVHAAARRIIETQKSHKKLAEMVSTMYFDDQQLRKVKALDILERNGNSNCTSDIWTYIKNIYRRQHWALQMMDATAKPESGIMNGNIVWAGNFEQCISTKAAVVDKTNTSHLLFNGRYCTVALSSQPMTAPLGDYSAFKIGMCLPDSCSSEDVESFLERALNLIHVLSTNTTVYYKARCHLPRSSVRLTSAAIGMICFLSLLVFSCLLASFYDIVFVQPKISAYKDSLKDQTGCAGVRSQQHFDGDVVNDDRRYRRMDEDDDQPIGIEVTGFNPEVQPFEPNLLQRLILAFSIPSNSKKILSTDSQEGMLGCINGIRFISMSWVILGHVYVFEIWNISNLLPFLLTGSTKQFTFQVLANATVSVDTFFLLSGFLTSYLFIREVSKVGGIKKINWLLFYVHRFWRLTPPYMLVLGTYTALYKYLFDGPFWRQDVGFGDSCPTDWWKNLLYINNFYDNKNVTCMAWAWYLANDMQFYVVSPLFLIPFALNGIAGIVISCLGILSTMIVRGVISHDYKYGIGFMQNMLGDFFNNMYQRPWTRISPFIIGIIGGYIIQVYRGGRIRMPKWVVVLGWCLAAALALSVVYGPYDSNRGAVVLSVDISALYNSTFRVAWSLAVVWVIIACVTGHGGWVNNFLSWKLFMPLARLTYLAYLVHPVVIMAVSSSRLETTQWDNVTVSYMFIGHMVISYAVAFMGSLLFESPFMGIERALRKR